jgi:hypothetical protein
MAVFARGRDEAGGDNPAGSADQETLPKNGREGTHESGTCRIFI